VPFAGPASAQDYPTRPITFIVPFPAGGFSDIVARTFAQELQTRIGQTIVVENRVGASGMIGAAYVARAAPDGYTIHVNAPADVTNVHYLQVPYDILKDFSPIGWVAEGPPLILIVNPNRPYRSVADLVAGARAAPDKLSFGSSGPGASPSISITHFNALAKVRIVDVPYRSQGQAAIAVSTGEVDGAFSFQSNSKPLADDAKVRALASTAPRRTPSLPDLPTMIESGFADFEHNGFVGLAAPANTPAHIVAFLNKHVNDTARSAFVRQRFEPLGMTPRERNTPEEFAAYLRAELARQGELAKLTGPPSSR
jgi:tripartite-type tricarboxylate transporter receptor subunit TctC